MGQVHTRIFLLSAAPVLAGGRDKQRIGPNKANDGKYRGFGSRGLREGGGGLGLRLCAGKADMSGLAPF